MTPDHSASSWRWHTDRPDGRIELAWVHERRCWLKRFRPADADGHAEGWTDPQRVDLDVPDGEQDAAGIAEGYLVGLT